MRYCLCINTLIYVVQEAVRRESHQAFWLSHHLFIVFWFALLLHGPLGERSILFLAWFCVPLLFYLWRRLRAFGRAAVLREVTLAPPNVLRLAFDWSEKAQLFK